MKTRISAFLHAILILLPMASAHAQISQEALSNIALMDRRGAVLPPIELNRIGGGRTQFPNALAGRPALLLLVDFTCSTMCGTTVGVLAQALEQTPIAITRDYSVLVIGFDPKDDDKAAASFRDAHLQGNRLAANFEFLRGARDSINTLARAIGFSSAYDAARDQFAHPAVAIVVTPDWRISRVLDALDLTPFNLRLALTEAADGRTGTLSDRITLLCYGWDAAAGTYTLRIRRVLAIAGGITVVILLGSILVLRHREKLALEEEHRG